MSFLLAIGTVCAEPRQQVAVELVLALDTSASVDGEEFRLQLEGITAALRDPEVLKLIENLKPGGAAISVLQWGGPGDTHVVIPFLQIRSARDAKALSYLVSRVQRWEWASETSIASAISDSTALLDANDFDGIRRVIDVSGDGQHNGIDDLMQARKQAHLSGIDVNGLAIEADDAALSRYYRENVIVGPNAFVETARDFSDVARAMKEKLLRELRPMTY